MDDKDNIYGEERDEWNECFDKSLCPMKTNNDEDKE